MRVQDIELSASMSNAHRESEVHLLEDCGRLMKLARIMPFFSSSRKDFPRRSSCTSWVALENRLLGLVDADGEPLDLLFADLADQTRLNETG